MTKKYLIELLEGMGDVRLTSKEAKELLELVEKHKKYRKWFSDNATNLANHRIGGYKFVDFPDSVQPEQEKKCGNTS